MKAVVDTNVFVSSFFGGNPRRVVDLWKNGDVTLCLSGPILDEYLAVLRRLGLDGEPEYDELVSLFRRGINIRFAASPPEANVVKGDPSDDKFVACAAALGAECIISGDAHLLRLGSYGPIRIVTPAAFLASEKGGLRRPSP